MSAFFRPQTPRCALRRHELRLATVGAIFGLYFRYLLGILGWRLLDWEATSPNDRGSPRMQQGATIFFSSCDPIGRFLQAGKELGERQRAAVDALCAAGESARDGDVR